MPIDTSLFSSAPIEGLEEDCENWLPASEFPPLPAPGIQKFYITNIREVKATDTPDGQRIAAILDYKIEGGADDDKVITFQRLNNISYMSKDRGRSSGLLDLVKSAGYKKVKDNAQFVSILNEMEEKAVTFQAQGDWQGQCMGCNRKKLRELTGMPSDEVAKASSTVAQRKESWASGEKARHYRDFPPHPRFPTMKAENFMCTTCGGEVRAQYKIVRYIEPSQVQ